jgi:hypothetical protein
MKLMFLDESRERARAGGFNTHLTRSALDWAFREVWNRKLIDQIRPLRSRLLYSIKKLHWLFSILLQHLLPATID